MVARTAIPEFSLNTQGFTLKGLPTIHVIYPQKSLYIKKMPRACWNVRTAGTTKVRIERVWNI
jgi:hypothetical protein